MSDIRSRLNALESRLRESRSAEEAEHRGWLDEVMAEIPRADLLALRGVFEAEGKDAGKAAFLRLCRERGIPTGDGVAS